MNSHSSISPQPTIGPAQCLKMRLARRKPKKSAQRLSKSSAKGNASKLLCPFCSEVGIKKLITRKFDLIRHFKNFHKNSELWRCPEIECGTTFDWKRPFEIHLEKTHPNAKSASKVSIMTPFPQLVFACGFSNCKAVFEVGDGGDADEIANEFFEHVANKIVKHSGDKLPALDWKYSVRFRNLMRQEAVDRCWKERTKGHPELVWQPHNSFVLRKLFETRRFSSTPILVQWAITLGSPPFCNLVSPVPKLPPGLALPIEDNLSSTESSDHGPQPTSNVQPGSLVFPPAPPATGPVDLGEPFIQLPPVSPQHLPVPDVSGTMAHQPIAFSPPYHGSQQAHFFQSQIFPGHAMLFPNPTYHAASQGSLANPPAQQQPSPYPVGPLSYGSSSPGFIMQWDLDPMSIDPQLFAAGNYPYSSR